MDTFIFKDIQDTIDQVIQENGLLKNAIKMKELKDKSISISFYEEDYPPNRYHIPLDPYNGETKLFTLKQTKNEISVTTSTTSLEKVQIPTEAKITTTPGMKKNGSQGRITFTLSSDTDSLFSADNSRIEMLKFVKALIYHFLSCYVSKNEDFACCDSYNDCKKCKKCLHPNRLRGMGGCLYFRYHLQELI